MKIDYHSSLRSFVLPGRLPLWVNHIEVGRHPSKVFHDHEYSELTLILSGCARHLANASSATIAPGDILLIHPGAVHAYDQAGELELINVIYDYPRLSLPQLDSYALPILQQFFPDPHHDKPADPSIPVLRLAGDDFNTIKDLFFRLEKELVAFQPGNLFCSLAHFMELVVKIARLGDYQSPHRRILFQLGDVLSYLHKNFANRCPVDELAQKAYMSKRNFFRQFRIFAGCSPIEYQIRLRLQHACEMLLHSNDSLSSIASHCGFYDSNDLCQKFRRQFATTPRRFRLQKKGEMDVKGVLTTYKKQYGVETEV